MKCSSRVLGPIFLAFVICTLMIDATAAAVSTVSINNDVAAGRGAGNENRKHKHHLFLLMGGLKTLAALLLIKIKIVLVAVAIFGILAATMKFLGVFNKFGLYNYPTVIPTYYGSPATWEHSEHSGHEHFGHDWSKTGIEGGRSLADIISRHPELSALVPNKN